jgi:FkbM family methyltransferase
MKEEDSVALSELISRMNGIEKLVKEIRTLVGPFGTMFPDSSMLVQTIHGIKYYIDPSDEIMAPQLVIYRQWEADLSAFMANSVTPNTIFLDIGANFGYFTCLVASRIGNNGTGRVIAVEPNPQMQRLLRRNIKVNWSMSPVEIFDCAATDQEGFVEFSVPKDRAANASLVTSSKTDSDNRFLVKSNSIDQLVAGHVIDICKIDVEGFEATVLKGAEKTIARSPNINIIIEWSLEQMRLAGFLPADLLSLFEKYNLTAYRLPPTRFISDMEWEAYKISHETLCLMGYDNILLRKSA